MSRYCCTVLILVHAISHLDLCTSLQIGLPTCHSPALTVAFPGTPCPPISSKHTHTLQTKNHTQIHTLNTHTHKKKPKNPQTTDTHTSTDPTEHIIKSHQPASIPYSISLSHFETSVRAEARCPCFTIIPLINVPGSSYLSFHVKFKAPLLPEISWTCSFPIPGRQIPMYQQVLLALTPYQALQS